MRHGAGSRYSPCSDYIKCNDGSGFMFLRLPQIGARLSAKVVVVLSGVLYLSQAYLP